MPDQSSIVAHITIADYVGVEASGKANIVGAGITLVGFDFQQGVTTPFAIWVRLVSPMAIADRPAAKSCLWTLRGSPSRSPGRWASTRPCGFRK